MGEKDSLLGEKFGNGDNAPVLAATQNVLYVTTNESLVVVFMILTPIGSPKGTLWCH